MKGAFVFNFRKNLEGAQIDEEMGSELDAIMTIATDGLLGYKLSPKVFVIKDRVTSLTPLGWVHVYRSDLGKVECSLR
jgi:hypothetical protein